MVAAEASGGGGGGGKGIEEVGGGGGEAMFQMYWRVWLVDFFFSFNPLHIQFRNFTQLKMLNRIPTVKDNETVVVDVPSLWKWLLLMLGGEGVYGDVAVEESLDGADIPYMPPIQIVMIIVGTRVDVQPFVAIGKHLHVSPS
jgi:hypothetical protein